MWKMWSHSVAGPNTEYISRVDNYNLLRMGPILFGSYVMTANDWLLSSRKIGMFQRDRDAGR